MPPTRSQLLQTANAFISGYNEWTIPSIISIRSPSCVHHVLPASVEHPSRNNAEFAALLENLIETFSGFCFTVIDDWESVVDVDARKVVLHLNSHAETKAGPYQNEYMFIVMMSEDGEMVDEIFEFIDSGYTARFRQRLREME